MAHLYYARRADPKGRPHVLGMSLPRGQAVWYKRHAMLVVGVLFVLAILSGSADALPTFSGDLDATFGNGGIVVGPLGNTAALAVQPDGKIVAVGATTILRLLEGGALDPTFGVTGTVDVMALDAQTIAVALQADGKIVLAGRRPSFGGLAVLRLHDDGTPDETFGIGGRTIVPTDSPFEFFDEVAVDPEGRVVASASLQSPGGAFLQVARFDETGALDPTFGGSGTVDVTSIGTAPYGLAVQQDGAVVLAAGLRLDPTRYTTALTRLDATGAVDTSFGTAGVALVEFGTVPSWAVDVAVQPNGRIVVISFSGHGDPGILVARLLPDGSPDPTFGNGGVTSGAYATSAGAGAVQTDGKVVVAGRDGPATLVRYTDDGQPDTGFGLDGVVEAGFDNVGPIAIDGDGRIVLGGYAFVGGAYHQRLARFLGEGPARPRCVPSPFDASCDDGNPCTSEGCDLATSSCRYYAAPGSCDADGNECTEGYCTPDGECEEGVRFGVCSDDGDPCTLDVCMPGSPEAQAVSCTHSPDVAFGCTEPLAPRASMLTIVDGPGMDRFRFRWSDGTASKSSFGAPMSATSFHFCAFMQTPGIGLTRILSSRVVAAPECTADACWRERTHGWRFRSGTGEPDGLTRLSLSEGTGPGLARIDVRGGGPSLSIPAFPLPTGSQVIAQVRSSDGHCWGSSSLFGFRSTDRTFVATTP